MREAHKHSVQRIQEKHGKDFDPDQIAKQADLNVTIVEAMLKGKPVYRHHAKKALKAMSMILGWHYTLDTVQVELKPDPISFIEMRTRHYFNIRDLAEEIAKTSPVIQQGVRAGTAQPDEQLVRQWEMVIYQMLVEEPVKRDDALKVLLTLYEMTEDVVYTLEELNIKLLDTPLQGE